LLCGVAIPIVRAQQVGLGSYFASTHESNGPVNITGKTFTYDYKTDTFVVTGDAVITQYNTILTAEKAKLQRRERILYAKDKVHIVDPLGDIRASEATLNLNDETSVLTNATITNKDKSYVLKGEKVDKLLGQRYKVLHGFFTTCGCDPGTPDWSITGDQMDLHMGETATSHNGYFDVLGHPLIYLPYAVFPADTDRSSGFLGPRMGESSFRGFQLVQPWFWAINKSSDATVALDVETQQRIGLLGEYRLITGEGNYFILDGAYYNESFRTEFNRQEALVDPQLADPTIPINRYDIFSMMRQSITPDLTVYGDAISVSDSLTLRELNQWTLSRNVAPGILYPTSLSSLRNAASDFGALYTYDDGFARLQGTWNQDLIQAQKFSLQTLPDLLVSGSKQLAGGLAYTDYDFQADNFWRRDGESGTRLDLDPRLTVPWRLGDYLFGYGTLGLRETLYSVGGDAVNVIPVGTGGQLYNNALTLGPVGNGGFHSRELIDGNAGVGTEIEKIYNVGLLGISQIKNTIEPFATYAYVPSVNQSALPLYDEVDRVEPRSLFTYGVTSRLFARLGSATAPVADDTANEQAGDDQDSGSPSLLQPRSYHNGSSAFELLQVTLLQAYDVNHAIAKGASRFADFDGSVSLFPLNVVSLNGQLGYSPLTNGIRNASFNVNFQPWWTNNKASLYMGKEEVGSFLQVGYDYIAPGPTTPLPGQSANLSQFLIARAYYDLFQRMGVYFAPTYDLVTRQMISAEYGIRIKSPCDCWSFDTGITQTINPNETQYQFQLTLGGLGSIGQNPFGRNPFQTRIGVLPNVY
jgi:LPS-assembly protein